VLRAVDKADKFEWSEVEKLLGPGRKDESGDFTKGAALDAAQIEAIYQALRFNIEFEQMPDGAWREHIDGELPKKFIGMEGEGLMRLGLSELGEIAKILRTAGYENNRIRIDSSVVRGLEYYTGPVYEVELLLETRGEKGRSVRFGSVGGGGRYDGLVSRFRGELVPSTGFSIGVSRLQAALAMLGKLDTAPAFGPVVVTVFDRDRVADYQKMVAALRSAGIHAELYLGSPKNVGNQLKYADRRNSPCVIIQGGDELNDPDGPQVIVKDLLVGSTVTDVEKDRDRYLQTHRAIQQKVPVSELAVAVQQLLNWHGIVGNKYSGKR
jgi:histidyl-tRNA synthetase